jgi:hypothetical protein
VPEQNPIIMKNILVVLFCLPFAIASKAQTTQPVDSLYIVTYTTGALWDASRKPEEQPFFKEHSSNLSSLRKAGTIKFGARYAEKGIIVIAAKSLKEAKVLVCADQAVVNKLFEADVQKLNVFYPWKEQR